MTFVYVRISVILWRSENILSLPLITFHLIQDHHHGDQQQPQQQRSDTPRNSSTRPGSLPNSPNFSDTRRQSG